MSISHFFKNTCPNRVSGAGRGFTLIELVVVVAIIVIVTGVVLTNLPAFRSKISLDLIAEEVAITIRQAQVYGIGTREFGAGNFPSHGIHFDAANPNALILFADLDCDGPIKQNHPNNAYDPDIDCQGVSSIPDAERREVFEFHGGVEFSKVLGCVDNDCEELPEANLVFRRPDPEAIFNPTTESGGQGRDFNRLIAVIHSPQAAAGGQDRHVVIWNTGQIYACNPEPANSTCPQS